jgi:DtxR family Mn-dependent transcriptional regulator
MMPSLTVENYLKAVLQISTNSDSEWVSTGELALALNVSPGTVTSMLKTLADSELATYKPYEGVRLARAGRKLALRMLRRHRLIELFLVNTLNLTWDQIHVEAENMEHAVSDFLIDRIDEYLGRPVCDPHGDPIPTANGVMRSDDGAAVPLMTCQPGARVKFVRVINQGSEFLRYLTESGIELGAIGTVKENNSEAGLVITQLGRRTISMGSSAAGQLLVEQLEG